MLGFHQAHMARGGCLSQRKQPGSAWGRGNLLLPGWTAGVADKVRRVRRRASRQLSGPEEIEGSTGTACFPHQRRVSSNRCRDVIEGRKKIKLAPRPWVKHWAEAWLPVSFSAFNLGNGLTGPALGCQHRGTELPAKDKAGGMGAFRKDKTQAYF